MVAPPPEGRRHRLYGFSPGHRGKTFEVESYLHSIDSLKRLFLALDLEITGFDERAYLGAPLVFGFCLKKRVF
jgi:hypothetical protein